MALPAQRHLVRLVGQYNGRPLYVADCDPPAPGRALVRLVGQYNGRPLYTLAECRADTAALGAVPMGTYRVRLVGQYNGRPLYVLACCGTTRSAGPGSGSEVPPSGSLGSESSPAASASSPSSPASSGPSSLSSPASSGPSSPSSPAIRSPASPGVASSASSASAASASPVIESPGLSPVASASSAASASSPASPASSGPSSLSSPAAASPTSSASGSGSPASAGGGISVVCCDAPVAATLYATFGGSLSPLGTVVLTWSASLGEWTASGVAACGGSVGVRFRCVIASGHFAMTGTGPVEFSCSAAAVTCDPLLWQCAGTALGGPCAGAYTVEVVD